MTVLFLERFQVIHVTSPSRFLCVPGKVEFLELANAFGCNAGRFSIGHELVLFSANHHTGRLNVTAGEGKVRKSASGKSARERERLTVVLQPNLLGEDWESILEGQCSFHTWLCNS